MKQIAEEILNNPEKNELKKEIKFIKVSRKIAIFLFVLTLISILLTTINFNAIRLIVTTVLLFSLWIFYLVDTFKLSKIERKYWDKVYLEPSIVEGIYVKFSKQKVESNRNQIKLILTLQKIISIILFFIFIPILFFLISYLLFFYYSSPSIKIFKFPRPFN